jgi:cephalosporin-C deacetylase-like acetyl esterase
VLMMFNHGTKQMHVSRILLFALLAVATTLVAEDPENWLIEPKPGQWVVAPSINGLDDYNVTPNSTALARSLTDASQYVLRWAPPADPRAWQQRKPVVREQFLEALGLSEFPERTPLNSRVVSTHDMGDYTMSNVVFFSRPDLPVTGNLYRPRNASGKLPAVVCPIGHWLELGKRGESLQARCIKLVKMGYVVLIYDAIGHGERALAGNSHHEAGFALMPLGQTVAGWMVWDSMRAHDYLLTLPEVDPGRIGITGNSGGGLNSLFTAAVDTRFTACAMAGYVFHFNNWIRYSGPHCTCCGLPGLYRKMEWFEVAGLIAPRALLMMQGSADAIFPISGARVAGRLTESVYAMEGVTGKARFAEFEGYSHGYHQPFREAMYGWMDLHLAGRGGGEPIAEGEIVPMDKDDPRLLCDKDGSLMKSTKSVVELAREMADTVVPQRPEAGYGGENMLAIVNELTAAPDPEQHYLMPRVMGTEELEDARLEKIYFLSEVGQHIPGLLWLPTGNQAKKPHRTVLIVDHKGKASVAESALVRPLVERGFAVLSVDLRGRGETLGLVENYRDNNYHFAWHSVLFGKPLAGQRAFDLIRTVDFIQGREDLSSDDITLVGLGDEVPAALLAAAADKRITRVLCNEYMSSFRSLMQPVDVSSHEEHIREWNAGAMRWGRFDSPHGDVDLGNVLPGVLAHGDIPELAALIAPRPLLYGRVIDGGQHGALKQVKRFQAVLAASKNGNGKIYSDLSLTAENLLEWIEGNR